MAIVEGQEVERRRGVRRRGRGRGEESGYMHLLKNNNNNNNERRAVQHV
jgi:hypothetical protein